MSSRLRTRRLRRSASSCAVSSSSRRVGSSRGPCSSSSALVAPVTTASGVRRSCETELRSELRSCSVSARRRARRASSASCVRSSAEPMRPANVSRSCRSSGSPRRVVGRRVEREDADAPARALAAGRRARAPTAACRSRRPAGRWCSHDPLGDAPVLVVRVERVRPRRDAGSSVPSGPGRRTATRTPKTSRRCRAADREERSRDVRERRARG